MYAPPLLILASHGTEGARRAQELAFSLALPGTTCLLHLLVIPDLWEGMQGDDWLNNASTRAAFGTYLETLLADEAAKEVASLREKAAALGIAFQSRVRVGDPTRCLLTLAQEVKAPVVLGPPRKRGWPGLRSGMDLKQLLRELNVPLFLATHEQ